MKSFISFFFFIALCSRLCCAVTVAPIFSSHMVLQQGKDIVIWGTAKPSEVINVTLGKEQKTTKAKGDGNWIVRFAPRKASKDGIDLDVNDLHFTDILIGELWLCSGQSNMAFTLKRMDGADELIKAASIKTLRLMKYELDVPNVSKNGYTAEQLKKANVHSILKNSSWRLSDEGNASKSYAVAWLLGKKLVETLDVPVGIIMMANGGSAMNNWIAPEVLQSNAQTAHFFTENWLENEDVYINHRVRCRSAFKSVLKENTVYIPGKFPYRWVCEPSILFEAGIEPLKVLSFRGVLWYQGESDATNTRMAKVLFPMLISNWRDHFGQADLPFIYVQLPTYKSEDWPLFREFQREAESKIKNTHMVSTIDLGDSKNLHPKDKQPIGERAARLALKYVYGYKLLGFPTLEKWEKRQNKLYLYFSEIGEGFKEWQGEQLNGFEVGDKEGQFRAVEANVSKDRKSIVINGISKDVESIRYAWSGVPTPAVKLFNSDALPLGPFLLKL